MTAHSHTTTGSIRGHAAGPGRAAADRGRVSARGRPRLPALQDATAVVFDTDGVITDSARMHAAAWKTAFDACLRAHPAQGPGTERPFDVQYDYLPYVDGKARLDGAASFLASRRLQLPVGSPDDLPGTGTVAAVAARKEQLFKERLRRGGIEAYPGTLRLLRALHERSVPMAAVSASRHAGELLAGAGVLDFFTALVDGAEATRLALPGKPDPALFVEAARRLTTPVERIAVIEDALAGVEAGHRGGFGLVIGVDRTAGPDTGGALLRHGADLVVRDLAELIVGGDGRP